MMTATPSRHAATLQRALERHRAGDLAAATHAYLEILTETPDHVDALRYSGLAAYQSGQHEDAAALLGRAVALRPRSADAQNGLGLALRALGRMEPAIAAFRAAIAVRRKFAYAHNNLGVALKETDRLDEAIAAYEAALRIEPGHADALGNLGIALKETGQLARAEQLLRRAIDAAPARAALHSNLGSTLRVARRLEAAEAAARRAIALDPALQEAHYNLGTILTDRFRWNEALCAFDAAIARQPDFLIARWNRALVNLTLGRYDVAWSDFRCHPATGQVRPELLSMPQLPERMEGASLLVYRNQGLGDELFFLRFAQRLRARGARIAYHGDARLVPMLRRSGCTDSVEAFAPEARVVPGTLVVPVDHLPWLLGHGTQGPFPAAVSIPPDADCVATARAQLAAAGPAPYLAVTWQAGSVAASAPRHGPQAGHLYKSVPPQALGRALAGWPGTIVSLQRLPSAADLLAFSAGAGRPVVDLAAANDRLEDMLALLAEVDEYVAVSNTNVHLRVAAGRGARVLVPWPPEWRWGLTGDSPWFPGLPVLRQGEDGDWSAALADLSAAFRVPKSPI